MVVVANCVWQPMLRIRANRDVKYVRNYWRLAQLVEQKILILRVLGSTPRPPSKHGAILHGVRLFCDDDSLRSELRTVSTPRVTPTHHVCNLGFLRTDVIAFQDDRISETAVDTRLVAQPLDELLLGVCLLIAITFAIVRWMSVVMTTCY